MDFKLELVLIPVADVDRAKQFYVETCGFTLDVDHQPNDDFRVVQVTPPGSACSLTFGIGITDAAPGTYRGTHLVVTDIEAARAELADRGVEISEIRHMGPTAGSLASTPSIATTGRTRTSAIRTGTRGCCRNRTGFRAERYIRSGASTPIRSSERAITAFVAVTRPSRNACASEPSTLCSW